jgi:type IV secretory pathway VirB10-like protein
MNHVNKLFSTAFLLSLFAANAAVQVNVTMKTDGKVISSPTRLVAEGQPASFFFSSPQIPLSLHIGAELIENHIKVITSLRRIPGSEISLCTTQDILEIGQSKTYFCEEYNTIAIVTVFEEPSV